MKRLFLFLATNLAVVALIGVIASLLGVGGYTAGGKLNLGMLMGFALVVGFTGSFVSLLLSKKMALWSTGAQIISTPKTRDEAWLVDVVGKLSQKAGIKMPEVAIYDAPEPNAFATGPSRSNSLVAVSTGLLAVMRRDEAEAVMAHEVAHVANGDMVTMTLIQGVVNTFVVFLARVVGFAIDSMLKGDDDSAQAGHGFGYAATVFVLDILFGILASFITAWFSRQREFRADAGAAELMGSAAPMKSALMRLASLSGDPLPSGLATSGISGSNKSFLSLLSTHPPIEERVAALSKK